MDSKRTQLQLQIAALKQEQSAVKQQQHDLNIESMEGVNKLVAKEMIVNQDSHFKNEITKLESMVANNDFQMFAQKNGTNATKATAPVAAQVAKPVAAPVSTPQVAKPVAKPVPDAAAVVAANEAALEANAQKEQAPKSPSVAKKTNEQDINIETSKLDDTNFDNLGQSLDSNKSKEEIKKEAKAAASELEKKQAAEVQDKKQAAEDKKETAEEDDEEQTNKSKQKDDSKSFDVETSSLADPFESNESKPKESTKI